MQIQVDKILDGIFFVCKATYGHISPAQSIAKKSQGNHQEGKRTNINH